MTTLLSHQADSNSLDASQWDDVKMDFIDQIGDATQAREAFAEVFEKVERAKREWESTVDSLPSLICLIDPQGRLIRANRIVQMWNIGRVDAVKGRPLHEFLHPDCNDPACYLKLLATQIVDRAAQGQDVSHEASDSVLGRYVHIDSHPIPDRDQTTNYATVIVIHDITERQRVEQEHKRLIADLNDYAHMVAHDLKNPVGVIIGLAEVLETEIDVLPQAELRTSIQSIGRLGRKLNDIIDELLLLAEIEDRDAEVQAEPLHMGSIVANALDRVENLRVSYKGEIVVPETWPLVFGQIQWIEEVWVNYLSNALKYGGRPARVEIGSAVQPDGMVRFWVHDNGRGISPALRQRLFTKFGRLGRTDTTGHGLGLSIAQRIVAKLGGTVGFEDDGEAERGSTFYFTLPSSEPRKAAE